MELEISVKPATQTQDNERNIKTKCDEGTMAATHEMHNKSHSKQMLYLQLVKSKFNNGRNHSDMFLDIGVSTKHCTKKKNQKKKMEMLIKNPRYKWFSNCN